MGFSLFKFLKLKKSKRSRPTSQVVDHELNREVAGSDVDGDGDLSVRKYSWSEIERVTLNFSKVIGYGGFSNVYLGQFFRGSKQGAVKIHIGSDRLNQVFKQELDILLRLSHVNIVKLLGYCDEREEGALVFEYIPNGNLQEKLHGSSRNYSELPWRNRMAIAFQLTKAIEYLHEKCSLQIVHGDIKASNILLDENLNCKLCDFGSAKMGFSSMVQPPSSSPSPGRAKQVMMIGSPGYTDPHYLKSGIASKKNDIYSLGVIILELVTGKEAFNPEREESLAMAAAPMLREIGEGGGDVEKIKVAEYIDPRLMGEFDLEEAKTMLFISGLCLRQSPTLRPSATQILQSMKEKVSSINFLFPEPHKG